MNAPMIEPIEKKEDYSVPNSSSNIVRALPIRSIVSGLCGSRKKKCSFDDNLMIYQVFRTNILMQSFN